MTKKKTKLLLVGWDAADWQIINPLLSQGKLPGIARLMHSAAWGNLATLNPPISPMLWTSISTGKRPYKHGIHGFTELAPDKETVRPVRVTSRKCKAVWNILNDHGHKTNVIGWWPSHPAEKVDGVYVSNFYGVAPEKDKEEWPVFDGSIYPEHLTSELAELRLHPKELTAQIMRNFFPNADGLNSENDAVLRSAMRIVAHASSVHSAATHIMENTDWDFTAVYYDALDHFSHLGMKYHPPKLSGVSDEDFNKYSYLVEAAYRFHDMMLDRLMDLAGEDCQVVLVSDHGFESGMKRLQTLPDEPGAPALEHRPYGVFIGSGSAFNPHQVYGASLLDVSPTILNIFGLGRAEDMDGTLIKDSVKEIVAGGIKSYELSEGAEFLDDVSSQIDQELIHQLEDLGYIKSTKTASDKKLILSENEFYLAKSFADGGKLTEAYQKMKVLAEAFPDIVRYGNYLASLMLQLGKMDELEAWIKTRPDSAYSSYLQGMIYLHQNKPLLAANSFDQIKLKEDPVLLSNTAVAWFQAGNFEMARNFVAESLKVNPESHQALNLLGDIKMQNEDWEAALSSYFKSLGLIYYQPQVHEKIAKCFYWLNMYEEAAQSLEVTLRMAPLKTSVKQQLINIYSSHFVNKQRLSELEKDELHSAIIVSGFPRSGTSMMMKMLEQGGLNLLSDEIRLADQNNPEGYFELEAVKSIGFDQSFLQDAGGKALKIVMPLLRMVNPILPLKVIWMEREITSTLKSQESMKGQSSDNLNLSLIEKLNRERELMHDWVNQHPHISYLKVQYDEAVKSPEKTAIKVREFLGLPVDIDKMAEAIRPDLRHF